MYIVDKYILSKVVKGYLLILAAFMGLYVVIDLFSNLSDFLRAGIRWEILLRYYVLTLPLIFLRVSPFSLLISTLYTFTELNRHNEILGMRTMGISILKMALPIIAFAFLVSSGALYLQENLLLDTQRQAEDIKLEYLTQKNPSYKEQRNIAFRDKNLLYFISRFIPQDKSLLDVIIFKESPNGSIAEKMVARRITFIKGVWIASDVVSYNVDAEGAFVETPFYWKEKIIDLDEQPENLVIKKSIFEGFTTLKNLHREIARLKRMQMQQLGDNLVIEFHRKLADPFSHIFLIIGVLPFALEIKKRKAGLSSLGIGFIVGFIYYVVFSTSIAFGKAGLVFPFLAPWMAGLFFLIVGLSGLNLIR
ncbi:MAG: LptF/LptG family permease [Candidatus Omnitrophica bacterium]|nr:LptF/LptG family permease [Candidatus Omnitrophota bacterium]